MPVDMWGMQGGSRQAEEDLLGQAVQQTSMAHTLGQIAMQPAQGRLLNAQAGEAEMKLSNEQRLQQVMAGMGAGATSDKPLSMADSFSQLATNAFKAGLPTEASKFTTVAGTIAYRDVQAKAAQAKAAKDKIAGEHQQMQLYEGFTRGVNSQEDLDLANNLFQQTTGQPAPFAGMPYSPERMEIVRNSVLQRKDMLAQQNREITQTETHEAHQATNEFRNARLKQHDAEQEVRQAREARLNKNGGKVVGAPTKSEFAPAMDILQSELFGGALPEGQVLSEMKIAATDLASEAKRRVVANRGLDYGTALAQAYQESKSRGDWQDLQTNNAVQDGIKAATGIDVGSKTKKYDPLGRSPQRPLALPKSAKEAIVGKFYRSPDGRIAKWNGKGFEAVGASGGTSGGGSGGGSGGAVAPLEEEDPEEEE